MSSQNNKDTLVIGTRGSRLSLAQTGLVINELKKGNSDLTIETKIITTTGDTNQAPIPLDTVGKTWFTAEIEQALKAGEIDVAVHSLKDMSPEDMADLPTVMVLKRADPRDVLISKSGGSLNDLPHGAIIGTDSVRRKAMLLDMRPDLVVKSIRGNVDTRIKKLHDEQYDALVLAAAGLERLGMLSAVTEFFDPTIFSIAPGQGVLAAQTNPERKDILEMLHGIEDVTTRIEAEAELAFSRAVGGGCKMPIGCYARIEGQTISIYGMIQNADGKIKRGSVSGKAIEALSLAEGLAKLFL